MVQKSYFGVLGHPAPSERPIPDVETMHALRNQIRGCPEPLVFAEAGHFLQEWGEPVSRASLRSFGDL
jgi:haloalkane dehalogenase